MTTTKKALTYMGIRIDIKSKKEVDRIAKKTDRSASYIVRTAISDYIAAHKND